MARTTLMNVVVGLILAMAASTGFASALTRAADKLVADQVDIGGWTDGSWPGETDFAGEPTIGLTHAYERTNNSDYKTAAENGGAYSLSYAGYDASNHRFTYGLFPAEMYAMARLSAIQADPHNNYWRTALVDNLNSLNAGAVVTWYQDTREDSAAAYDVARIAVAANYADHASKTVWRDGAEIHARSIIPG